MDTAHENFFRDNPEGAVVAALDSQEEGLLFGAVELRDGRKAWLDYELESSPDGDTVSLYREAEDAPVLEYRAKGRRVDTVTVPDRLLILWNRGRRALAVDGDPLSPGEITSNVPENAAPWLLRFAAWLPDWE